MESWNVKKYIDMEENQSLDCDELDCRIHRYKDCWLVVLNRPIAGKLGRIIETAGELTLLLKGHHWNIGKPLTDLLK